MKAMTFERRESVGSGAVWRPHVLLAAALYLGGSIGTRFIPTIMVTA
jgi:hypothetical protein